MRGAGGSRIAWEEIPAHVRSRIAEAAGGRVVEAVNQAGGFSPGLAARCALEGGDRVFVKAVSAAQNPRSVEIHRCEAVVAAHLPDSVPAPRLLATVDHDGWVALVFEEVDGRQPHEPWTVDDLDLVLPAITRAAADPNPVPGLEPITARLDHQFSGWRRLAGGEGPVDDLDPWVVEHLDGLATLEAGWSDAGAGTALLHSDLRGDNLLIGPDGAVTIVDWPWACVGAAWLDPLFMVPSVGLGGGPDPMWVDERYGVTSGLEADAVDAVLAALAGFFVRESLDPPPPGIPMVRAFQAAQGRIALDWLRRRIESRARTG